MPPKSKAAHKAKDTNAPSAAATAAQPAAPPQPPRTVHERSQQRYDQLRPHAPAIEKAGLSGLSPAERAAWASTHYLGGGSASSSSSSQTKGGSSRHILSNKGQKELWRHVNEASLPLRALKKPRPPAPPAPPAAAAAAPKTARNKPSQPAPSVWGRDRAGRDVGDYALDEFRARTARRLRLTALEVAHCAFEAKRDAAAAAPAAAAASGDTSTVTITPDIAPEDLQEEKQRRAEIAVLRMELYGQRTSGGSYAQDPAWDDIEPIALDEPEGALAAIAYPEAYSEAISYLRAVMTKPEYSPRCLGLTEHVIALNPAHYTVWLYRFSIVRALRLPVPAEIEWLNGVALQHLKNYQIWHHRYLLAEFYYPQIADDRAKVTEFARSEVAFMTQILAEDTKNYHVWSYRHYIVKKLGYFTADELRATEVFLRQDVRNNSAWAHRFFVVFSDPSNSSAGKTESTASEPKEKGTGLENALADLNIAHDPAVPAAVADREVAYAQDQIRRAPQNESPWHYLRGALTKAGRPLASVEAFAAQFAKIGEGDPGADEVVQSTHALDVLAAVAQEKGETAKADRYLRRLAEKWDPIRAGYWQYRRQQLAA